MIQVQFVNVKDFVEELDERLVQEGIVRLVTYPQGEQSPTGERMHVTEAGALFGDQLRALVLIAHSAEAAEAQAAQIRKGVEEAGLEIRPGRYT